MAEKSSLVDTKDMTLEINDSIDEFLKEDVNNEFLFEGQVQDSVMDMKQKFSKRSERKKKREEEEKKHTERVSKELKDEASKRKWKNFFSLIFSPFLPSTWVKAIQYWEELLYVIFIDTILIMILFSFLIISYIIVTFDETDDLTVFICKLAGSVCLIVLCVIIQMNTTQNKGSK